MKRAICIFISLALCLCAGCARTGKVNKTLFAMDTVMELSAWGKDAQEGLDRAEKLLQELEETWSAQKENSLLSKLNKGEKVALTDRQQALLDKMEELSVYTGGAFDPKLLAVSTLWNFTGETHAVPTNDDISKALTLKHWDLGAALKGYAGQQAVEILETLKIDRALLNLGGNIQTYGKKADGSPWNIGIQNPDGGDPVGIVAVTGTTSVVTSGDYQRYFELDGVRYHHIIDPATGYPADTGLRSVTVICEEGLTADVLSTALFVMGLEKAATFWQEKGGFEAVFITAEGEIYATAGAKLSGCEFEVISYEN